MNELIEKALHAAEQNMTDVVQLYATVSSQLVFGEAVRDMKNDGLKLVKAARKEMALTAALAAPIAALLSSELQNYQVQCRKFGTAEWFNMDSVMDTNRVLAKRQLAIQTLISEDSSGDEILEGIYRILNPAK